MDEKLVNRFIIIGRWDGDNMIKVTDYRKGYWAEAPLTKKELWKLAMYALSRAWKCCVGNAEKEAFARCLAGLHKATDQRYEFLEAYVDPWLEMALARRRQELRRT